jgi:uncharacterized protein
MWERYWLVVAVFHAGLLAWTWALLRRAGLRARTGVGLWARLGLGAILYLAVAIAWAGLLSPFAPSPRFMFMRLICHALFAEGVLLSGATALVMRRQERHAPARVTAALLVILLAIYGYAYHVEPFDIQVRTHQVTLAGARPRLTTLRILHLSDIQAATVGEHEERALRLGLEQAPELIVFTGDLAQADPWGSRDVALPKLRRMLRSAVARAPLGAYAVQGNMDRDWPQTMEGSGFVPLSDSSVAVDLPGGRRVCLTGLTLRTSLTRSVERLRAIVKDASPADARIVLGHSPDFTIALAKVPGIALALAGHTHGGQVVLPFFGPPLTFSRIPRRNVSGLTEIDGLRLHVSSGIGLERGSAPPIRFLCPPTVCLLELSL